ncbi:serine hydrolase [Neobacillus mesonae]|nr:serine hydrolase [Neobacillus mesonae]
MSNVKKKKKPISIKGAFLLIIVLLLLLNLDDFDSMKKAASRLFSASSETSNTIMPYELYSTNAKLVRLENNETLFAANAKEKVYPASLTKIMTTILAIEHLSDLQQTTVLDEQIFPPLTASGAAMAGFSPGEQVKAVDLLYGTMLPSGAEAATALAVLVHGSEQKFVSKMNEKAAELGMQNTHFTNPTGLHNKKHYSTVDDLTTLLEYALQNEQFKKIFTTLQYNTSPTSIHPDGITLYSTLSGHTEELTLAHGEIKGGKTGYTDPAGLCLASYAIINGQEHILITTGADGNSYTEPYHLLDAVEIYRLL